MILASHTPPATQYTLRYARRKDKGGLRVCLDTRNFSWTCVNPPMASILLHCWEHRNLWATWPHPLKKYLSATESNRCSPAILLVRIQASLDVGGVSPSRHTVDQETTPHVSTLTAQCAASSQQSPTPDPRASISFPTPKWLNSKHLSSSLLIGVTREIIGMLEKD